MGLLRPTIWTQQPQQPVPVDRNNPLCTDMCMAVLGAYPVNLVSKTAGTFGANSSLSVVDGLRALKTTAETGGMLSIPAGSFEPFGQSDATFFVLTRNNGMTVNAYGTGFYDGTSGMGLFLRHSSNSNHWGAFTSSASGARVTSGEAAPADGLLHGYMCFRGADGVVRTWRDGVEKAGASSTSVASFPSSPIATVNGLNGLNSALVETPLVVWWRRALSDTERAEFFENYWQIFQPIPRRNWARVVSGTTTTVNPGVAHAILSGKAPSVSQSDNHILSPGAGHIAFVGHQPSVISGANVVVAPLVGHGSFSGYMPTVQQTAGQVIAPSKGALIAAGYAPSIIQPHVVSPTEGHLAFSGYTPQVLISAGQTIAPAVGHGVLSGHTPEIIRTTNQVIQPGKASLVSAGHTPSIVISGMPPSAEAIASAVWSFAERTLSESTGRRPYVRP